MTSEEKFDAMLRAMMDPDDEALAREFVALEELSDEALLVMEMSLEDEAL